MIKSIIHAGGESTRLREVFNGPKALIPVGDYNLLWYHMQPLLKYNVKDYIFTLRYQHELIQEYLEELKNKQNINYQHIVEPKYLGRAGVVKLAIDKKIIDTDNSYLMSNPDDLIPVNVKDLFDYSSIAESKGKSLIMVMARYTTNPFGIGEIKKSGEIIELKHFKEKPKLPLIKNHYANTGMMLFLPDAMKEFENVSLDKISHPEQHIVPKLTNEKKVAVFLVDRWFSVNYKSDYERIKNMGHEKLLEFLNV
jgi:NDP-sugar pyrophosphorylase family protein